MSNMLECDQCHKRVAREGHVGWLVLHRSGIDVSAFGEINRYPYHFCSLACLGIWAVHYANPDPCLDEQAQAIKDEWAEWRQENGVYTWPGTERPR